MPPHRVSQLIGQLAEHTYRLLNREGLIPSVPRNQSQHIGSRDGGRQSNQHGGALEGPRQICDVAEEPRQNRDAREVPRQDRDVVEGSRIASAEGPHRRKANQTSDEEEVDTEMGDADAEFGEAEAEAKNEDEEVEILDEAPAVF